MVDERPQDVLAGSWIMDGGAGQFKTICSYAPIGDGKFTAVEFSAINFDWTLDGLKPTATHGTTLHGILETDSQNIGFVLIAYALDKDSKAVYLLKAVGNQTVVDQDTLSVENLVFHFYNDPETANPVTDRADFCVPHNGTFPPVRQYRIRR
jgi:hypothetical protein